MKQCIVVTSNTGNGKGFHLELHIFFKKNVYYVTKYATETFWNYAIFYFFIFFYFCNTESTLLHTIYARFTLFN